MTSPIVYRGNKFNLTELFEYVKRNVKNEIREIPKFSKEEDSEPVEEDDQISDLSSTNNVEDEFIDISNRFDNTTKVNESQQTLNDGVIKDDL